jgi:phosphomannomutase
MNAFNYNIIKGYDIRGIFKTELSQNDIFYVGLAIGFYIHQNFPHEKKIVIGYDNRSSSKKIFSILSKGLSNFNIKIYNIGYSSSPILSFSTIHLNCFGIMITASHNQIHHNGMKISKAQSESLDGEEIKKIIQNFFQNHNNINTQYNNYYDYQNKFNDQKMIDINIFDEYLNFLFFNLKITKENFLKQSKNKKIAFDFLGSTMEKFAQKLFSDQKNYFFVQNKELVNEPDPTLKKNLLNLQNLIREKQCDFGFAFDGDCDRITTLDENGNVIEIEHLAMILASATSHTSKKIIHDNRCSSKLKDFLENNLKLQAYQSKIGHSIMKKKIKELDADLSCETSGHFIFKNLHFDDGFFISLFLILYLSSEENKNFKLSEKIKNLPEIYCSENIKIYLKNEAIEKILNLITQEAQEQNKNIELFDGIKILDKNGWIFFRQSKTEECLTIKFESYKKENFSQKELEMRNFLKNKY